MMARRLLVIAGLIAGLAPAPCAHAATGDGTAAIQAGREALRHDNPAAAKSHFEQALSRLPGHNRRDRRAALLGLGHAAFWLQDYRAAERAYREALTLAETREERLSILPKLARTLSVTDRPRAALELLAETDASSLEAAIEKSRACLLLDREACAAQALEPHAQAISPATASGWLDAEYLRQQDELNRRLARAALVEVEFARDSDGLHSRRLELAARFQNGVAAPAAPGDSVMQAFWQFGGSTETLRDNHGAAHVSEAYGQIMKNLSDGIPLRLRLGGGQFGGWDYTWGAFDSGYRPGDAGGFSFNAESGAVKTVTALQNRITQDTVTLGGDHRLGELGVGALAFYRQHFSDGNDRDGTVVRVNFDPHAVPEQNLSLRFQIYARRFRSEPTVNHGYFNPREFHEEVMKLFLSRRLSADWSVHGMLGAGRQVVDRASSYPLSAEISAQGRLPGGMRTELKAGYGDASGLGSSGNHYHRSYANAFLFIPF
jgi:tetratricopeptide (TPR) repeat protein